jgi:hypothetical protein
MAGARTAVAPRGETRSAYNITKRQHYEQLRAQHWTARSSFDPLYRELSDNILPGRVLMSTPTSERDKGDRRNLNIIDNAPVIARRTLQHGLHSGLTSPARPWFKLSVPDPDLAEQQDVKEWLHTVTTRMQTVFLRSNLYTALPTLYGDISTFASAAMGVLEDDEDLIRAYVFPLGTWAAGIDSRGIVNTFIREFSMSVRQVVEAFGVIPGTKEIDWTPISSKVKSLWMAGNHNQAVDVSWVVAPNIDYEQGQHGPRGMRFASCYFEKGANRGDQFLREAGFRTFPVLVPRWDVRPDDTYGSDCPGITALGDCKGLQLLHKRYAQLLELAVRPPVQVPTELQNQPVSQWPGAVNAVDMRDGHKISPIHEVRLEGIQHLGLTIQDHRNRINDAFFANLFLMLQMADRTAQPVTAREIEERHEEKLLALGPVLERLNDELLDPLIDRAWSIMEFYGLIPQAPEALQGQKLRIEYVSLMAQAQKLVGAVGLDRFVMTHQSIAAVYPEVKHKVDAFQLVDAYGDMLGISPKIIRPDEAATELRDAENQAVAAQHTAELAKTGAQAAQALGNTPMQGGGSALDEVGRAMGVSA